MQARYYDPVMHRFLSLDPWEGDITNPQTLNKYSYSLNSPVNYFDPDGREPVSAGLFPIKPVIGPQWNSHFVDLNGQSVTVPGVAKGGYFHPRTGEFHGDYVTFFEEGLGIPRNKPIGQNIDPSKRNSTSLEGLKLNTALGTIRLSQECDCDIVITGGTEAGHAAGTYSHANGYKVDFRITDSLNSYVDENLSFITETKYGPRYSINPTSENADIYNKEIRINAPHYDVKFRNKYTYPDKEEI